MKKKLHNEMPYSKKDFLILIILLIISLTGYSQNVGIRPSGTIGPDAAAGLDVNFADKGLLIPRVALTNSASFSPLSAHIAGMIVYNTATAGDVTPGFYYDNGTKWNAITLKASSAGDIQYWNGTSWVTIPVGQPGQALIVNNSGVPAWSAPNSPTINTNQLTSITSTSAVCGGIILNDGGSAVSAYGVCWATVNNPTIGNSFTTDGVGIGSFSSNISGLTTGTVYYVRAYATTSNGTSYGNVVSFTTP